jgi:hypothetical protein
MTREKNIGGIKQETKDEFKIRQIKGQWHNHDSLLSRMIVLYDKYNDIYEKELKCK